MKESKNRSRTFASEKGAVHIFGTFFLLFSVYSTYLLVKQQYVSENLSEFVRYQKKQIDSLELRMQILEFRKGKA